MTEAPNEQQIRRIEEKHRSMTPCMRGSSQRRSLELYESGSDAVTQVA